MISSFNPANRDSVTPVLDRFFLMGVYEGFAYDLITQFSTFPPWEDDFPMSSAQGGPLPLEGFDNPLLWEQEQLVWAAKKLGYDPETILEAPVRSEVIRQEMVTRNLDSMIWDEQEKQRIEATLLINQASRRDHV